MTQDDLVRPEDRIDAVLQLLDRQLVDSEGALAGKVDDVELTEADGELRVTAILVGVPAWLPRTGPGTGPGSGRWWLEWWRRLAVTRADRTTPGRIPVARVAELDQAVRLDRRRDGLVRLASTDEEDAGGARHRLSDLLPAPVTGPDGTHLGHVLDVRLAPAGPLSSGRVHAVGLIVGRVGRPGSLLGYERSPRQGPWLLARLVRAIHRHTAYLPIERVAEIDWEDPRVRLRR